MMTIIDGMLKNNPAFKTGRQWYAGDHVMFASQGIPCLTVTSADLFDHVMELIHTGKDTAAQIDCLLIHKTAAFLAEVIETIRDI